MSEVKHYRAYESCELCPRQCGVNRLAGETGYCGQTSELLMGTMVAHHGEEPCIAGTAGSGTLFFSGCSCGCFFCQNHQISQEHVGRAMDDEALYDGARKLLDEGVHNLNFVTPEHWWPHIRRLCERLRSEDVYVPFVWNSSGYFRVEMLKEQSELIDIFLPDFKYADPKLAAVCMGDERYPELAMAGIRYLAERVGNLRPYDETGEMTASRGLMIRHLVLPGQVQNSLDVLQRIADEVGTDVPISVMSQFMPVKACHDRKMFERKVTKEEYETVCEKIDELGFRKVFVQYDNGEDGFLPDFTQEQPFAAQRKTP